jgi:hypothetical protein
MIHRPAENPATGPPFGINTKGELQRGGKKNPCEGEVKVAPC